MRTSREEFEAIMRRFPSYAETAPSTVEVLYQDFLDAQIANLAEPIDYFKYRFFDISDAERGEYLTRRQYAGLCARANDAALVESFRDKAVFYNAFRTFLGRRWLAAGVHAHGDFARLCEGADRVVVKPRFGGYGRGVEIVPTAEPDCLWSRCLEEEALVEEVFMQHAALSGLYPCAVNCVRVVTVCRPDGSVELVAAALRCGRGGSVTDSGDGLFASIDLSTGAVCSRGISHFSERFDAHPDTGVEFQGFEVPGFDSLCATAIAVAASEPRLRLMNWDFACRIDGAWCLIEGNFAGGIGPCQEASGKGMRAGILSALGIDKGE